MGTEFNQHYQQMVDTVNSLTGYNGSIQLKNHIDMGGNRVTNVGSAVTGSDVLTQTVGNNSYSASALRPQLEANGSNPLQTTRRLNDQNQQELYSSFLNSTYSTVPNANTSQVFFTNVDSTHTQITVPAMKLSFADSSYVTTSARTDTVSNPTTITISTASSTGNTVTIVTLTAHGLSAGSVVYIAGVSNGVFNGTWVVTGVSDAFTFTFTASLGTQTGTGGTITTGKVYYYYASRYSTVLTPVGGFTGDTAANRLNAAKDGSQIVVVATITQSGGQVSNSGGGGSPISGSVTAGTFF